jgi:excisionase family DNA binding protein
MERLLTIRETAEILAINLKTAYEYAAAGRLPGLRRIGGALRVNPEILRAWLEDPEPQSKKRRRP